MSLEALVSKYIGSAEKVLGELQLTQSPLTVNEASVSKVVSYVEAYLTDAKYYKAQKRFETSLTSVAYCEGLLDALRLLGAVRFEWPEKPLTEK
jgi:FAD synthetase